MPALRLVAPSLIVLVGPSGSGKSTWAAGNFEAHQIVSSDSLRALVGEGEHDQRAGTDAFDLLDEVLARRLRRRLLTVIDTLGLEAGRRARWRALASSHGLPCYAIAFDTPAKECRARNKARGYSIPSSVLSSQLHSFEETRAALPEEGFVDVLEPGEVELVSPAFGRAAGASARQKEQPMRLEFGLQIPRFGFGRPTAEALAEIAGAAEDAGFKSLWVMDHFIQIPQAGREWDDMLESWTTLGYLAAHTRTVKLGTLVTGITYRNAAHVAKLAATLDTLSQGRAMCGVGAAWFEREHRAYGWEFPSRTERFALLEDALQLFPLMWGPGAKSFEGRRIKVAEAICYPRPIQERIPILVGGSGERRTLKLVAKYADACNLFGEAATVAHKVGVLHKHCASVGRDPSEIAVTHLATALVGEDREQVDALVDRLLPKGANRHAFAAAVNAGTVDDHIGRFRELAEAGVQTAIFSLPDLQGAAELARVTPIIQAFRAR
jgi:F420-dependent oxidoreductase-like protein